MFKVFRDYPEGKVVYIAPLKALVRERMEDWRVRLGGTYTVHTRAYVEDIYLPSAHSIHPGSFFMNLGKLGKKVVELTGDVSPDVRAIQESSVIVTTPEKWDGISRSW